MNRWTNVTLCPELKCCIFKLKCCITNWLRKDAVFWLTELRCSITGKQKLTKHVPKHWQKLFLDSTKVVPKLLTSQRHPKLTKVFPKQHQTSAQYNRLTKQTTQNNRMLHHDLYSLLPVTFPTSPSSSPYWNPERSCHNALLVIREDDWLDDGLLNLGDLRGPVGPNAGWLILTNGWLPSTGC